MTDAQNITELPVKGIDFAQFLMEIPLYQEYLCIKSCDPYKTDHRGEWHKIRWPKIKRYCEKCKYTLDFGIVENDTSELIRSTEHNLVIAKYICQHCKNAHKRFILIAFQTSGRDVEMNKIGEWPPFGPPIPAKLSELLGGPERDLFFMGRRAESQGMGIGAFGYYRRVVENQKNRLFDEIIEVAEKLGKYPDLVDQLKVAKGETQFTKAIESIKAGWPEALLVNGYNPLRLLHSALSEGLHALPDQTCLELAQDIRIVLTELAERLSTVIKDDNELNTAVSRLANRNKSSTNAGKQE